jgi:hypothetical protein
VRKRGRGKALCQNLCRVQSTSWWCWSKVVTWDWKRKIKQSNESAVTLGAEQEIEAHLQGTRCLLGGLCTDLKINPQWIGNLSLSLCFSSSNVLDEFRCEFHTPKISVQTNAYSTWISNWTSLRRVPYFGIWRRVVCWMSIEVSGENIASIFKLVLATYFHAGFLLSLFFRPWKWRRYVPPKRRLTLKGLHGVISQKLVLFITTAVRTSNPTF